MTAARDVLPDHEAVDWSRWLWAPPNPGSAAPVTPLDDWLAEADELLWPSDAPGGPPTPAERERTRALLALFADPGFPPDDAPWTLKLLHCPDPRGDVVPVMITYLPAEGEPEQALRALLRVGDPGLVEPPVVDPVSSRIGNGLRGLAYTRAAPSDGASVLLATLAYAWRVDIGGGAACDVRLWTTWTPSSVVAVADDVEALARTLTFVEDDGA